MAGLPHFPADFEGTRKTLHAYAQAAGVIPRAHAAFHPKWWHASLKVRPDGLVTDPVSLPDQGSAFVRLDPRRDAVVFTTSHGDDRIFPMNARLSPTEMGDALLAAAAEFGLEGEYDRSRFGGEDATEYDGAVASAFFDVLVAVEAVFSEFRDSLSGDMGPIQLWPHGFDLAFEWFGTRTEKFEEDGEIKEYPSQINLGFYPAGRAYFYSNPWPFEADELTGVELPSGAAWNTEGWEGSILYYDTLEDDPAATQKLRAFASVVHEAAAPTLTT